MISSIPTDVLCAMVIIGNGINGLGSNPAHGVI